MQQITKDSVQYIKNKSFDATYQTSQVELVGFDSANNVLRPIKVDANGQVYVSGALSQTAADALYKGVPSVTIYVDGNRIDSYTPDGTINKPFITVDAAVADAKARSLPAVTFNIAATDSVTNAYILAAPITMPAVQIVIYGNQSMIIGDIEFPGPILSMYDIAIIGDISFTSGLPSTSGFNNFYNSSVIGDISTDAYLLFDNSLVGAIDADSPYESLHTITATTANSAIDFRGCTILSPVTGEQQILVEQSQMIVNSSLCAIESTGGFCVVVGNAITNYGAGGGICIDNDADGISTINIVQNNRINVGGGSAIEFSNVVLYSRNSVFGGDIVGHQYFQPFNSDLISTGVDVSQTIIPFEAVWFLNASLEWTDNTAEALTPAGTPFSMAAPEEYLYFGLSDKYSGMSVKIATDGGDFGAVIYEYWDGIEWVPFVPKEATMADAWRNDGYAYWNPEDMGTNPWVSAKPSEIEAIVANSMPAPTPNTDDGSKYWVRVSSEGGDTYSTMNRITVIKDYYFSNYYIDPLDRTNPKISFPISGEVTFPSVTCPKFQSDTSVSFNTTSTVAAGNQLIVFNNNGSPKLLIFGNGAMAIYSDIFPMGNFALDLGISETYYKGTTFTGNTNSTAVGSIVYIGTSSNSTKAKADSITTMPAVGIVVAQDGTDDTDKILISGTCYFADWTDVMGSASLTIGAVYYVSAASAGLLTATKPTTAGQVPQVFGVALTAKNLLVNPAYNKVAL